MKKDCTTCGYAEWQTTTAGKRKLESPGKCKYPAPAFPHCYEDYCGNLPEPRHITKWTKPDCPCWAPKAKTSPA